VEIQEAEQKQAEKQVESKKKVDLSTTEVNDIFDRMTRVQRQQITTTYAVDKRFLSMQNRIDKYGQNWKTAVANLESGIGSFEKGDKIGDETFNELKTTIASISNINNLVSSLENTVRTASASSFALQKQQEARADEIAVIARSTGGWGIWVYLLIFQLIIGCVYLWYKKNQDDKAYKVLF